MHLIFQGNFPGNQETQAAASTFHIIRRKFDILVVENLSGTYKIMKINCIKLHLERNTANLLPTSGADCATQEVRPTFYVLEVNDDTFKEPLSIIIKQDGAAGVCSAVSVGH